MPFFSLLPAGCLLGGHGIHLNLANPINVKNLYPGVLVKGVIMPESQCTEYREPEGMRSNL